MDKLKWFKEPVTEKIAKGYHNIIKTPMDLGTILKKVENKLDGLVCVLVCLDLVWFDSIWCDLTCERSRPGGGGGEGESQAQTKQGRYPILMMCA